MNALQLTFAGFFQPPSDASKRLVHPIAKAQKIIIDDGTKVRKRRPRKEPTLAQSLARRERARRRAAKINPNWGSCCGRLYTRSCSTPGWTTCLVCKKPITYSKTLPLQP